MAAALQLQSHWGRLNMYPALMCDGICVVPTPGSSVVVRRDFSSGCSQRWQARAGAAVLGATTSALVQRLGHLPEMDT